MKPFNIIRLLGKGAMGDVHLVFLLEPNEYFAVKRIDKKLIQRPQIRNCFETEKKFLNELHHKNIIKLIAVNESPSHYYLTLEYCNGNSLLSCLEKYIKMYKKPFTEKIVQYLMRQIVDGLKCIHQHNIIHRDLKLANILVKFYSKEDIDSLNMLKANIKISDFGISIKADIAFTIAGSPEYTDPLILKKMKERNDLKNSDGYNRSADIWSLGAICYEMLTGRKVFNGRNIDNLYKKVEMGNYSVPFNLSREVFSFLNGMLQYDPNKRLNIEQLAEHDFLTKNINNFSKIDLDLFGSKVGNNVIKVNIKNNQTIYDLLNDEEKIKAINRILNLVSYDEFSESENKLKIPVFPVGAGLQKNNDNKNIKKNISNNNNNFNINLIPSNGINNQNNLINAGLKKDNNKRPLNNNKANYLINYQNVYRNNTQSSSSSSHQTNYQHKNSGNNFSSCANYSINNHNY